MIDSTAREPGAGRPVVSDVVWFFTIAILLCFALSVPMVFQLVPKDANNLIVPILQQSPMIAAIIMWLIRRPGTFRWTFATRWHGSAAWSGIGIGIIAAVAAAQTALALALGIWALNPVPEIVGAMIWILPVFLMQSIFAIGEEFGWRGWLATRAASWGFWRLALISGLVWIVWHLPVLAVIGDRPLWDIVIYFAGMLPWAPLLLALRWRSGSVWPAVLTHGAINSVRVFLLQSVPRASDHLLIEAIGWILTLTAAAWLMKGRRATGSPDGVRRVTTRTRPALNRRGAGPIARIPAPNS